MGRGYRQYCPIAHALELVGERWSLLVIRELLDRGPLRYSDLHARLDGCGTNILAARLKDLERGGVIRRRRLPPPAASAVYELTEYGLELRPVMRQLAHWGARSLGPPTAESALHPGWLVGALRMALPATSSGTHIRFEIGDETASLVDDTVVDGALNDPDAVVTGDPSGFYAFIVERDLDAVTIDGNAASVHEVLAALPAPAQPSAA
jgi:DNA-binding HxlR family transcriptional regulator